MMPIQIESTARHQADFLDRRITEQQMPTENIVEVISREW